MPAANVLSSPSGTCSTGSGVSNHSSPSTPSIGTAARRPPASSTMAGLPALGAFGLSPSSEPASATASTVPRRFVTPSSGAGAPGTAPMASSVMTSRVSRTSTASVRPPIATMHARWRCAPGSVTSTGPLAPLTSLEATPLLAAATSGDGGMAPGTSASSAGKPAHHAEQLIRRERLREVFVGALLLAPGAIAFLVFRGHQHDRRRAGTRVAPDRAQDLVAVASRHHDVE